MLTHLSIHNYALISQLEIDLNKGLTVITGETGAGKSIVLGALSLLMGGRADSKSITEGEAKCVIEGEFDLEGYKLEDYFAENELDYSRHTLFRRELHANGKSRSFVNDTPVSATVLRNLATRLIDIHSQHENLLLDDDSFQLGVTDALAGNGLIRARYAELYEEYCAEQQALSSLKKEAERMKQDADYLAFQYNQLEEAHLEEGELEQLEEEQKYLQHAEEIHEALIAADQQLEEDEWGVLTTLKRTLQTLERIDDYLPQDEKLTDRLDSTYIELKDIADSVARLSSHAEMDPARLAWVEERLDLLHTLLQKHHVDTDVELISLRDQLSASLQRNDSLDEAIAEAEKRLAVQRKRLEDAAKKLTASRQSIVAGFRTTLEHGLSQLGVAHAAVDMQFTTLPDFTETGVDEVQIMFAANLNQSLRPVREVASGGEVARLMLCIKAMLADEQGLPTVIFDEIDTGVSGGVADKMADIMLEMADGRQVIAITHLPQIAAKGEHHLRVFKQDSATRTETSIMPIEAEQRVEELAKMLSGDQITEAAWENARQLLNRSK